jgi:hypothetical protein
MEKLLGTKLDLLFYEIGFWIWFQIKSGLAQRQHS